MMVDQGHLPRRTRVSNSCARKLSFLADGWVFLRNKQYFMAFDSITRMFECKTKWPSFLFKFLGWCWYFLFVVRKWKNFDFLRSFWILHVNTKVSRYPPPLVTFPVSKGTREVLHCTSVSLAAVTMKALNLDRYFWAFGPLTHPFTFRLGSLNSSSVFQITRPNSFVLRFSVPRHQHYYTTAVLLLYSLA